ncbi:DNA-binding protein YbaB [Nocardia transvalensis]|uniref:DNA-binding protein YbaB n=1 Tax=Nocardia transvalensis TaxID=37333 RepID=A0A7W9UH06_9NOCA|nr:YbaB/EbfC family nucleoid-associated protein [Nocardia transvalensis]MBB5912858.1 DNA-binding protein YbaB [Nocardia transvalensis]
MVDDVTTAQFADLMESLREGVEAIARVQRQQAQLTATASAAGKRVTVMVNAKGVVIQTRFGPDIEDLTYAEIAAAVTSAAQDAAGQVFQRTRELVEGLRQEQSRLPNFSDFLPGMPDVEAMLPEPPEVSTAPPGQRPEQVEDSAEEPAVFTGAVTLDPAGERSNISESSW